MLSMAVEWERLAVTPKMKWLKLPPQKGSISSRSKKPNGSSIAADRGQWRAMILVAVRTGLRLSAGLRALHWG